MATRFRSQPVQGASEEVDSLAELPTPSLSHQVELARQQTGLLQRSQHSDAINRRLETMPGEMAPAEVAAEVLALLDQEVFHGLVDSHGVPCRKKAIETVLALGFPHALSIEPDDLDYLRLSTPKSAPSWLKVTGIALGTVMLLFFIAALITSLV